MTVKRVYVMICKTKSGALLKYLVYIIIISPITTKFVFLQLFLFGTYATISNIVEHNYSEHKISNPYILCQIYYNLK